MITSMQRAIRTIAWPSWRRWRRRSVFVVIGRIALEDQGRRQLLEKRREEGVGVADRHLERVGARLIGVGGAAGGGRRGRALAAGGVVGRIRFDRGGRIRLRDEDPAGVERRVLGAAAGDRRQWSVHAWVGKGQAL